MLFAVVEFESNLNAQNDEFVNKLRYSYTLEYYAAIKNCVRIFNYLDRCS